MHTVSTNDEILTIEEFVERLSPFRIIDPLTQLFTLYDVYRQIDPQASFDRIADWGEALLRDFDEIDSYLVDARKLFGSLNHPSLQVCELSMRVA